MKNIANDLNNVRNELIELKEHTQFSIITNHAGILKSIVAIQSKLIDIILNIQSSDISTEIEHLKRNQKKNT
jgi:hypothetical protein